MNKNVSADIQRTMFGMLRILVVFISYKICIIIFISLL